MRKLILRGVIAAALASGAQGVAQAGTIIGVTSNGLRYEAHSTIVGTTSTSTIPFGGNPIYFATDKKYSGVVQLMMDHGGNNYSSCTGSLLADHVSILTAAHCVSNGAGTANPISTKAWFYNGGDPDMIVGDNPLASSVSVAAYFVNKNYTGQVIDENDIAILRLSTAAPSFATAYDLYMGDLTTTDFNVAGYGRRSTVGGDEGYNTGTGRLRQGDNRYEFRLGDPEIGGNITGFADPSKPKADIDYVYLADFDNGKQANDSACRLTAAVGVQDPKFCDLGRGATEANIAPGDSGGPGFVDGKIATVSSFGLTYYGYGDIDQSYNSSFGEFGGYVATSIHANWIASVMGVPEPSQWAMLLTGFAAGGVALRRRGGKSREAQA